MLASGSRSYYDDYVRKKGTGGGGGGSRVGQDPPALMTDRGAYVNFLEVQLERVSAACLSVQAYDQRFNDMQGMVAHLEENIGTLKKLVALSQECSQQIKHESDSKLEKMSKSISDAQSQSFRSLQAMSERVTTVENSLTTLYGLFPRMESMEHRLESGLIAMKASDRKIDDAVTQIRGDVRRVMSDRRDFVQRIEQVEGVSAKSVSDYQDIEKRMVNLVSGISDRTTDVINQQSEELSLRIQSIDTKFRFDIEKIDKELALKDLSLKSALASTKDSVTDELKKFEIIVDRKLASELSKSASETQDLIGNLTRDTEELQSKFYDLEKESTQQFQLMDETIARLDDGFQTFNAKALGDRLDAIEAEHRALQPIIESAKEAPFFGKSSAEVDLWMQNKVAELLPSAEKKPGNILRSTSGNSARDNMIVPNRERTSSSNSISRADLNTSAAAGGQVESMTRSINGNFPELFGKFLEAYQAEQNEIKRKIDSLSSQPPSRNSPERMRQLSGSHVSNTISSAYPNNAAIDNNNNNNNNSNNNYNNNSNNNRNSLYNSVNSINSNNATAVRQTRYLLPYFSRVWVPNNTSAARSNRSGDNLLSNSTSLLRSSSVDPLSYPPLNRRSISPTIPNANANNMNMNANNVTSSTAATSHIKDNIKDNVSETTSGSSSLTSSRIYNNNNNNNNSSGVTKVNSSYHRDHLVGSAAKVEKNRHLAS